MIKNQLFSWPDLTVLLGCTWIAVFKSGILMHFQRCENAFDGYVRYKKSIFSCSQLLPLLWLYKTFLRIWYTRDFFCLTAFGMLFRFTGKKHVLYILNSGLLIQIQILSKHFWKVFEAKKTISKLAHIHVIIMTSLIIIFPCIIALFLHSCMLPRF
jgi:hypothetical protein